MGSAYGLDLADNRLVLDTLLDFAHEQGLVAARPPLETLFVPDTVDAAGAKCGSAAGGGARPERQPAAGGAEADAGRRTGERSAAPGGGL